MQKGMARMLRAFEAKGQSGHSDLYRWLRSRHAKLSRAFAQHKPAWPLIAAEIAAEGIRGADGQVASANSVRQMWHRLCRDLEAEDRARRLGVAAKAKPARAPAGWQPPVVSPRPAAPTLPTTPRPEAPRKDVAPFARSPTTDGEHATDDEVSPEELMAGFKAIVAQRSGR